MLVAGVVVVGAGLAGARTCALLRSGGFTGRLTLLGAEAEPPYDRPPLTKDPDADVDLRAAMDLDVWAHADDVRLGVRARRLVVGTPGPGGERVPLILECSDGSRVQAGAVVVATGADPVVPEGWLGPGVHVLHTRRDAGAVWSAVRPGARMVIVGGGWVGCEAAATAAARGAAVLLLEAGPAVLAGRVPEQVSAQVAGWLAEVGVRVRVGVRVASIPTPATEVRGHPADVVLVALGVRPATAWLSGSPVQRAADGAVLVDGFGRSNVPGLFAIGDCAARWSARRGAHLAGGHWTEALNVPEVLAPQVARWLGGEDGNQQWLQPVDAPAADPIPYVFSEIAGRTLLVLGAPAPGRVIWRVSGHSSPTAVQRSMADSPGGPDPAGAGHEEAWTAFSLDSADRLVGLCTVGRPRDLVTARRVMLAHPTGTPRVDPGALADPGAAPSSMFPGEA